MLWSIVADERRGMRPNLAGGWVGGKTRAGTPATGAAGGEWGLGPAVGLACVVLPPPPCARGLRRRGASTAPVVPASRRSAC